MSSLEDKVREVVSSLIDKNELFTALDVSNAVKSSHPLARHREVRDVVRGIYGSDMQNRGYGRTPINVTLDDGSSTEALLYHSLSDSWDLDTKYDAQRRAAKAENPVANVSIATPAVTPVSTVVAQPPLTTLPLPAPQPAPVTPKQLWDNLFTPTRLFPKF